MNPAVFLRRLSFFQMHLLLRHLPVLMQQNSAASGGRVLPADLSGHALRRAVSMRNPCPAYMTETPILEGVANREYYGRSATSIENKSTIEYGTEQGLAALIYGEQGVSSLPIQDIRGEYMYYYSVEFIK